MHIFEPVKCRWSHSRARNQFFRASLGDRFATRTPSASARKSPSPSRSPTVPLRIFRQEKSEKIDTAAAGSPSPKRRTSWWSSPRLAPQTHAPKASAKSTNSYAHGARPPLPPSLNIPSAPAPEPPPVTRPRSTFPRRSAPLFSQPLASANRALSASSANSHSDSTLPVVPLMSLARGYIPMSSASGNSARMSSRSIRRHATNRPLSCRARSPLSMTNRSLSQSKR